LAQKNPHTTGAGTVGRDGETIQFVNEDGET
jgi:hypothetical protein